MKILASYKFANPSDDYCDVKYLLCTFAKYCLEQFVVDGKKICHCNSICQFTKGTITLQKKIGEEL